MVKSSGASVRIGKTKRPDNFTIGGSAKGGSQPGPGQYLESSGTFSKAAKGTASMGSKYQFRANNNPGPGQYTGDANRVKSAKNSSMKIGTTKRPDIWEK